MAGSGLFLGWIPTLLSLGILSIFLIVMVEEVAMAGIAIIACAAFVGLLWRHKRLDHLADISWRELYLFGWVVHLAVLPLFFLLPTAAGAVSALREAWLPLLAIYPAATMLLGRMLSYRLERERAAARLRESEERYRSLFERNRTIMLMTDPESGQIIDANAAAASFYGWSREELMQKNIHDIADSLHERPPESYEASDADKTRTLNKHQLADGKHRFVESRRGPITINRRPLEFHIINDVTEQKNMEDQFRQVQKLEAVGRLAGGVAHDYNNKLQAVLGFTELALRKMEPKSEVHGYLMEVMGAAEHSAQLTMQLMAFARKQPIHPCVLDMNDTIGQMLKMLKKLIGEDIELAWHPVDDPWAVLADPMQVDQILVNLAINARDAIVDTGKLTIETQNVTINEEHQKLVPESRPGEYVMVGVTDTGSGMSPEVLDHLFEPFFTTKKQGAGTGLGLATVYGIIQQNDGFIHVHSTEGEGSSFKVYLPRAKRAAITKNTNGQPHTVPQGQGETVLVVEDEKLVLDLVTLTLETSGYTVLSSQDPEKAIELVAQHPSPIDLLLTDVVMPGMNGRTLYENVIQLQPDIKVMYMSGYTANAIAHRGILDEDIHFIQKPFSVHDIGVKVREVLDEQTTDREEDEAESTE